MKQPYFLILFLILFILQSCQVKVSTTEQLSKKIFEALKENDFEQILAVTPNESALSSFYQQYSEQEDRNIKFDLNEVPNLVKILQENLKKSYEKVLLDAQEKEIDWKKCKFIENQETLEKDDFTEGATVVFTFDSGKEKLSILYKAIKIDGSWYIAEGLNTANWTFNKVFEEDELN